MPTVHLSLPESIYRELKNYAERMGVQITDLIKFLIKQGLEQLQEEERKKALSALSTFEEEMTKIKETLMTMQEFMERKLTYIEGRMYQFQELLRHVSRKVKELEDEIEEIKSPIIEPEIVEPEKKPKPVVISRRT